MNYLLIAITAYLLNAVSVLIDKILLVRKLPNPLLYVFYISSFSLVVLSLVPFVHFPNSEALLIGSLSTILWTFGAYFLFKALKIGDAVRVAPVIGTLIPIILLFMSSISGSISQNEVWAVVILSLGLTFLVLPYLKGKYSKEEILLETTSALFFANGYFLLKLAYGLSEFLPVLVYSRLILLPIILLILLVPRLKRTIFQNHGESSKVNLLSKTGVMLFIGQAAGGTSQLLLAFAISLANPAIVNSIQGIQYVFLFILSLILARKFPSIFAEKNNFKNLFLKFIGILLIFLGLWVLSLTISGKPNSRFGVTFSSKYAKELGLEPQKVFQAIISDLKPGIVRLPIYWDEVERDRNQYNFSELDGYLNILAEEKTQVILVLGFKQPRWPECFQPNWAKRIGEDEFNAALLELVKTEVTHFKHLGNITYWQLENEPFLDFGMCPKPDYKRVLAEIEVVKSLDNRPILMTDSGEISSWLPTMRIADSLGTSVYRTIWSPVFGLINYPIPPVFYRLKGEMVKFLSGGLNKQILISELQTEPWPDDKKALTQIYLDKQIKLFPVSKMIDNVNYSRQIGFDPVLLWGVEWWYFMKQNGVPSYWEFAKMVFNS